MVMTRGESSLLASVVPGNKGGERWGDKPHTADTDSHHANNCTSAAWRQWCHAVHALHPQPLPCYQHRTASPIAATVVVQSNKIEGAATSIHPPAWCQPARSPLRAHPATALPPRPHQALQATVASTQPPPPPHPCALCLSLLFAALLALSPHPPASHCCCCCMFRTPRRGPVRCTPASEAPPPSRGTGQSWRCPCRP